MYRGQYHQWVKLLDHHLRTAVGQTVHRGEHHAEAVEQGHADAELVISREAHVLSCEKAVVGNAVVGQHDTLREACSARGVLHVADIVAADILLHLFQRLVLDVLS